MTKLKSQLLKSVEYKFKIRSQLLGMTITFEQISYLRYCKSLHAEVEDTKQVIKRFVRKNYKNEGKQVTQMERVAAEE